MSETTDKPVRRGGWRRKLLWTCGILAALVLILYFVGTSSAFFKGVILPRVGAALNADVTVTTAEISPFHRVRLLDLKVQPHGGDPLLTVHEVRASYSLLSMLHGKIVVSEVVIDSPLITVIKKADGSSNLDPLLRAGAEKATTTPPAKSKSSAPAQVDIKLVSLTNATVRLVKNYPNGDSDVTEVSGVNFNAQDIKNGQAGKFALAAKVALDQAAQTNTPASSLRATLGGSFTFDLLPDLLPSSVQGNTTFAVDQATGALTNLAALTAQLDCDATPTEIKQLALHFAKDGHALGNVLVSGPFDSAKQEGKLKLEVQSLDRQVLNLAGAASGIDFGTTTINSSTDIELANAGKKISLAGSLKVANLQLTRADQSSPTLDLNCDYAATVDNTAQSAILETFTLTGTQSRSQLLSASLTSPMTIVWGGNNSGSPADSTLTLALNNLDLTDWKMFTGAAAPKGTVNAGIKLLAQSGGSRLTLDFDSHVDKFSALTGTNRLAPSNIHLQAHAHATDLKQFTLEDYSLAILNRDQTALSVSGSGTFDQTNQSADLKVAVQAALKPLLALQPQAQATDGALTFTAHVTSQNHNTGMSGGLSLTGLTGDFGGSLLTNYETTLNFDVGLKDNQVEIHQISGLVRNDQTAGGKFEASGKFDPFKLTGQLDAKLTDFNQNALRPFAQSALGGKQLVSVTINSTISVGLGANNATGIKADFSVTNLVVNDPTNTAPVTPLELRAQVDTTVAGQTAEFRQCQLTFTPTDRAKNQLNLTGNLDFSHSNAITGNLKLAADSLDVTRYYDLFAPKPQTNAPAPAKTVTPTPAPAPAATNATTAVAETEPDAMTLPLKNFNLAVLISRFYLREVDIASLQITTKIDGGKIFCQPCQLTLNGAPINAGVSLDLGVPGYQYDVNFDTHAVPLAPLVDSFSPANKGKIGGQLTASAALKGAGITGSNLKKNLVGKFDILSTNLNYSIADVRSPTVNGIINVIVGLPELIRGSAVTGQRGSSDWANQLTAQPIEVILAHGTAGDGLIQIQPVEVRSAAFRVDIAGTVTLADIRTNSPIHFPISLALGRPYADQIGLVNSSTPTNQLYIALPDFLTINGTLGVPRTDLSKSGLTVLAAKTIGGIGKQLGLATGTDAKSVYKTVGGWFKSKPDTNAPANVTTNNATTNSAAEPKKKSGILNIFKRSKAE